MSTHSELSDIYPNAPEIVIVKSHRVSCAGGQGGGASALGHPKVFMDMGQGSSVECKYCDRVFVLEDGADHSESGH